MPPVSSTEREPVVRVIDGSVEIERTMRAAPHPYPADQRARPSATVDLRDRARGDSLFARDECKERRGSGLPAERATGTRATEERCSVRPAAEPSWQWPARMLRVSPDRAFTLRSPFSRLLDRVVGP